MRNGGVEFDAVDYAKKPLDADTVKAIIKAVGSVGAVVNARNDVVKEKGWRPWRLKEPMRLRLL